MTRKWNVLNFTLWRISDLCKAAFWPSTSSRFLNWDFLEGKTSIVFKKSIKLQVGLIWPVMRRLTGLGYKNKLKKIGYPTTCPPTMNTKGSKSQTIGLIVSASVYLSTKPLLVMKKEFYDINTVKRGLGWGPMTPSSGQEWPSLTRNAFSRFFVEFLWCSLLREFWKGPTNWLTPVFLTLLQPIFIYPVPF